MGISVCIYGCYMHVGINICKMIMNSVYKYMDEGVNVVNYPFIVTKACYISST
jgi:hypothetical protein